MRKRKGKKYGDIIKTYSGKGTITKSDRTKLNCDFNAHQLLSGQVILLIEITDSNYQTNLNIIAFSGIENGGASITTRGIITEIPYLPNVPNSFDGSWTGAAYYVDEIYVQHQAKNSELRVFKFGLTNLKFIGVNKCSRTRCHHDEVQFDLNGCIPALIRLRRVRDYKNKIEKLKTLKGIDVTAELVAPPLSSDNFQALKQVVTDLCYILSIASGTKVQWVYCIESNPSRRKVATMHYSRITKPFSSLAPINLDRIGVIKDFVEQVYPIYVQRRSIFELEKGTIDAYLDAKIETDYIEMRGVKIAVAIEALKQVFLNMPDSRNDEWILSQSIFDNVIADIQREIFRVLEEHKIKKKKAKAIASVGKVGGLNRQPFGHILSKLCNFINMDLGSDTMLLVACRNSLVHKGRFYAKSADPDEATRIAPLKDAKHEFYFLINAMDRIYLKLVGFSGTYINWRQPGNPKNDTL